MEKLPILHIIPIDSGVFVRYIIENGNGEGWTGTEFTKTDRPRLFVEHNEAGLEAQNILKNLCHGTKKQTYVMPVFIEVHSDIPIPAIKIARYISDSVQINIDTDNHGHGPDDSLILLNLEPSLIEHHEVRIK